MARYDEIAREEQIVRALFDPYWDDIQKRPTPTAFLENDISVSRLSILKLEKLIEIFKADLDRPATEAKPERLVRAVAQLSVGEYIDACKADNNFPPIIVKVVEDEEAGDEHTQPNRAHALAQGWQADDSSKRRKFTRGMANKIIEKCQIKVLD